jgi:hypothetical protein
MAAADERDTSLPAGVETAGGTATVAMPARSGTSRDAQTKLEPQAPRISKPRQAKRKTDASADAAGAGKRRGRYGAPRSYPDDAQNLLGVSQLEIDRVASLPDLDLFKRPVGRPTSYHPSFCERAIRLGENGNSLTQIAVKLGIDKVTLLSWAELHPEFSTALKVAQDAAKAWWEDMGMIGLVSEKFNAGVWSKSMSARFRDEYVERRQTEIAGTIVEKRELTINARSLDPDAREALKQALLSVKRAVDGDDE